MKSNGTPAYAKARQGNSQGVATAVFLKDIPPTITYCVTKQRAFAKTCESEGTNVVTLAGRIVGSSLRAMPNVG